MLNGVGWGWMVTCLVLGCAAFTRAYWRHRLALGIDATPYTRVKRLMRYRPYILGWIAIILGESANAAQPFQSFVTAPNIFGALLTVLQLTVLAVSVVMLWRL